MGHSVFYSSTHFRLCQGEICIFWYNCDLHVQFHLSSVLDTDYLQNEFDKIQIILPIWSPTFSYFTLKYNLNVLSAIIFSDIHSETANVIPCYSLGMVWSIHPKRYWSKRVFLLQVVIHVFLFEGDAGRPLYVGIIIRKRLIHYGPLVMGFHRSLVDSPRKLPIMRNLEIPLEVHWISFWTNSRVAGFSDAMTLMCWWKPWSSCAITLIMNQTTDAHFNAWQAMVHLLSPSQMNKWFACQYTIHHCFESIFTLYVKICTLTQNWLTKILIYPCNPDFTQPVYQAQRTCVDKN